jgi:hypothetical protein
MSDKAVSAAVERFVKKVSFSTQRELERFIRAAIASGKLQGNETFTAAVTVTSEKVGLMATIYSKIEL